MNQLLCVKKDTRGGLMLVGLFLGFSFLALIFLVAWSVIGGKNKKKALLLLLLIILMWAILLHYGISHSLGIFAASCGLVFSISALFMPFVSIKKNKSGNIPMKLMKEIESRYIEEYLEWSDTTYGPSLLGTVNDYNRLLMNVLTPIEEEHPEIADHYDEILSRLKEIDPYSYESEKNT